MHGALSSAISKTTAIWTVWALGPCLTNQKLASGNGQRFSTKMDPSYPSATPIFRKGPLGKNSPTTGGRGVSSYLYTQIPLDYKASSNPK